MVLPKSGSALTCGADARSPCCDPGYRQQPCGPREFSGTIATETAAETTARPHSPSPIQAGAGTGTGKTTTLRMLAAATSKRGLYIAFNRAIADEAGRE